MTFRIVDKGWASELANGVALDRTALRVVCPFIKWRTLEPLLSLQPACIQVITRYNLSDFAEGVSDIEALRLLLKAGASVRGIRHLHAKLYIFGSSRAIVTSANLTRSGLHRNHEFGAVTEDPAALGHCLAYFNEFWRIGSPDLRNDQLDDWDRKVVRRKTSGGRAAGSSGLGDFGTDAGISEPPDIKMPQLFANAPQAFVKFLGQSDDRVSLLCPTLDEIVRAGCHWALGYPASKRPRNVKNGAVMFIGRLTDKKDIRIFGRAIGMAYERDRDDATPEDIKRRPWKKDWPRYVRVHDAEFVNGTMVNGVSLNELMDTLRSDSFMSTQRNAACDSGNRNPRKAYMQQPSVELSNEGYTWLNDRLQSAFDHHGTVPRDRLDKLDWPDPPDTASMDARTAS